MGMVDWAVMIGFILVIWYLHIIADKLDGMADDISRMNNYVAKLEADMKVRDTELRMAQRDRS